MGKKGIVLMKVAEKTTMEKAVKNQTTRHLGAKLEQVMAAAFSSAGWQVSPPEPHSELMPVDLIVEKPPLRYVIKLKVARDARREALQALLADAVLQARAAANHHHGRPLAVIGAPALSDRLISDLRAYMKTYAPDQGYGFIDSRGRLELFGPLLDEIRGTESLGDEIPYKLQKQQDMFSDLNQWLLKLLLASRIPTELLGAPRRREIRNAADLAATGRVSVPTASRFVTNLKTAGFLEPRLRRLELVRLEEMLKLWQAIRLKPPLELPTRFILPGSDPGRQLCRAISALTEGRYDWSVDEVTWRKPPRACLAQFSACTHLGFGFVAGVPATVYLDDFTPETLSTLGLRAVEPGESTQVLLQVPRLPESTFRAVTCAPGVPTTDVLQCWLDVSHHPARGQEQASLIWDRVLSLL